MLREHFTWRIHGYEWRQTSDKPYLVPASKTATVASYKPGEAAPTDNKTLFRTFAATPLTPEGILSFANRFGHLGCDAVEISSDGVRGESISTWVEQIVAMREVLKTFDALDHQELLEARILGSDGGSIIHISPDLSDCSSAHLKSEAFADHIIAKKGYREELISDFSEFFPVAAAAHHYIEDVINAQLKRRVSAQVKSAFSDISGGRLYLVPCCLAGFMWLQFANVFSGVLREERCPRCATYFPVGLTTKKAHKKYCCDSCRQADYRDRVARNTTAKRLHDEEGISLEHLSVQFETTVDNVQSWINAARRKDAL